MSVDQDREFEIKLSLRESDFAHLLNHANQTENALCPVRTDKLITTYYDTPDLALYRSGITIRMRRSGHVGKPLIQTVKMQTGVNLGISNPVEIEDNADNDDIDIERISDRQVRKRVTKIVAGQKLIPKVYSEVDRSSVPLSHQGVVAELSLDRATVSAGSQSELFLEAELELNSGGPQHLLTLAEDIFSGVPLRFSTTNKAARGFALLDKSKTNKIHEPVMAKQPFLPRKMSAKDAFAVVCNSAISQILPNWLGILEHDDPEFAHQFRVSVRRLRSALKMFRPYVDNSGLRALTIELQEIGRIVGDLRDADVMYGDIALSAIRRSGRQPENEELTSILLGRCTLMREAVRADIGSARWNGLLLRLALLGRGWSGGGFEPHASDIAITDMARKAISKSWKKVRERGRNLDNLDEAGRHQLRKDLKTLRYTMEFLQSLHNPKVWRRFRKKLKQLQVQFGYLNDVHMAKSLPAMIGNGHELSPDTAMLAGFIDGWHEAGVSDVLADLEWHWQRLERRAGFWR